MMIKKAELIERLKAGEALKEYFRDGDYNAFYMDGVSVHGRGAKQLIESGQLERTANSHKVHSGREWQWKQPVQPAPVAAPVDLLKSKNERIEVLESMISKAIAKNDTVSPLEAMTILFALKREFEALTPQAPNAPQAEAVTHIPCDECKDKLVTWQWNVDKGFASLCETCGDERSIEELEAAKKPIPKQYDEVVLVHNHVLQVAIDLKLEEQS